MSARRRTLEIRRLDPDLDSVGGTVYGHDPYTGPMNLTDVRPWADDAACRNVPHIFDAADGVRDAHALIYGRIVEADNPVVKAKGVCAGCPAKEQCLAEAMAEETGPRSHRYSVRGGLTASERAALWRKQKAEKQP